jgi:hypothetical protein
MWEIVFVNGHRTCVIMYGQHDIVNEELHTLQHASNIHITAENGQDVRGVRRQK